MKNANFDNRGIAYVRGRLCLGRINGKRPSMR